MPNCVSDIAKIIEKHQQEVMVLSLLRSFISANGYQNEPPADQKLFEIDQQHETYPISTLTLPGTPDH